VQKKGAIPNKRDIGEVRPDDYREEGCQDEGGKVAPTAEAKRGTQKHREREKAGAVAWKEKSRKEEKRARREEGSGGTMGKADASKKKKK